VKKIVLLALVLVLALGGLGVGYATWSQTLYVDTQATTGTFAVGIGELTLSEEPEHEDKDVAWMEGYLGGIIKGYKEDPLQPGVMVPYYEKAFVTVHNAYPSYVGHIVFTVGNVGTIPAHIKSFKLSDPTGELSWQWVVAPPATPSYGYFWKDFNGSGAYEAGEEVMRFALLNFVSHQLDPCSTIKGELDFHIEQPAEQGHTYTFLGEVEAVQWNAP